MLAIQVMQQIQRDARMREAAHEIRTEVGHLMDDLGRLHERVLNLQKHFGQTNNDIAQILTSAEKVAKRGGGSIRSNSRVARRPRAASLRRRSAQKPPPPNDPALDLMRGRTRGSDRITHFSDKITPQGLRVKIALTRHFLLFLESGLRRERRGLGSWMSGHLCSPLRWCSARR